MEKKYGDNRRQDKSRKLPQKGFKKEYDIGFDDEITESDEGEGIVVGRNAVRELLKSGRDIDKIFVQRGEREGSIVALTAEAASRHIPLVEIDKIKLDKMTGNSSHQGIVAMAAQKQYSTIEDILEIAASRGEKPFIVISDGITDPYNLGALIRCAEGAGAHGVIISKRRAVGLTPAVTKSSAGAIEHMAIAKVSNIANTIEKLKKHGLWIFSAEAGGEAYYNTDFNCAVAIVFGSEGNGVSNIVKENSDYITSIPMYGKVNSLNVSTAAAVILSEVARQQRTLK